MLPGDRAMRLRERRQRPLRALRAMLAVLVLGACGDDDTGSPADGGVDAPADAGVDAGPRDAGPRCDPACVPPELCCALADGTPACVDPRTDDTNCGECGIVCAEGRGTHCADRTCVCGTEETGCGGVRSNLCCPPREDGGVPYCANLLRDGNDCGACGAACDLRRADRCAGGTCYCGDGRTVCAGTDQERCCTDPRDLGRCVDTTIDPLNCGDCNVLCGLSEDCRAGECTVGDATCASGCPVDGEICCNGECCTRIECERGLCGTADGGM